MVGLYDNDRFAISRGGACHRMEIVLTVGTCVFVIAVIFPGMIFGYMILCCRWDYRIIDDPVIMHNPIHITFS